jgi:hypothetical protein
MCHSYAGHSSLRRAATGTGHGSDYLVQDYELGVLTAAKAMAMTVIDLLANGAPCQDDQGGLSGTASTKPSIVAMRSMFEEASATG